MKLLLRDYQQEVVETLRERFQNCKKVGIQLPTGSGKTEIAMKIMDEVIKKGNHICFATSSIDLIEQTYNRISKVFPEEYISIIRANDPRYNRDSFISILSIDTFIRREHVESLDDVSLFIIDEAHEAVADKYKTLFDAYPDKYYVGLSATFQPVNKKGHSFWNSFICGISGFDLMKKGHLPKIKILVPDVNYKIDNVPTAPFSDDYDEKKLWTSMEAGKIFSDFETNFKKHGMGKASICFCVNIDSATKIGAFLEKMGAKNPIVYHSNFPNSKIREKQKEITDLDRAKEPFSIVSVDKVSKGFDLPRLEVGFMIRPTKSVVKYRQQVGRLTRGKEEILLVDMTKNTENFGHPYDFIEPKIIYEKKSFARSANSLKRCGECFCMIHISQKNCIYCGALFKTKKRSVAHDDKIELKEFKTKNKKNIITGVYRQSQYLARKCRKGSDFAIDRTYGKMGKEIFNKADIVYELRKKTPRPPS